MNRHIAVFFIASLIGHFSAACSYRLTNASLEAPMGIRTIAIESVYDTSGEVIPHEALWSALQQAFIEDGNLYVTDVERADAIVRTHIKTANIIGDGSLDSESAARTDPDPYAGLPPKPEQFQRSMNIATEIQKKARISVAVEVDVWHLASRKQLMSRTFQLSDVFRTAIADDIASITTYQNDYLRYEENMDQKFHDISQNIARQVVKGLLVR